MGNVIKSIEIFAPPDKVFDFVIDFDKMNQIHEGYTQAIPTSTNQPVGVGTTAHFVSQTGGSKSEWDMKITEFERNRKLRWQSMKPEMANIITLEPTVKGTMLTHQTLHELPYSIFGKLMDKVKVNNDVNKEVELELEKTKKALES